MYLEGSKPDGGVGAAWTAGGGAGASGAVSSGAGRATSAWRIVRAALERRTATPARLRSRTGDAHGFGQRRDPPATARGSGARDGAAGGAGCGGAPGARGGTHAGSGGR